VKVLHTEWSTGWGGQEIRILAEMRGVRARGVEVMVASRPGAKILPAAQREGFRTFEIPFRRSIDPVSIWRLYRLIRRERIALVNTHSGKDTWNGGLAAKLAGARFVRTRHLYFTPKRTQILWINRLADFVITTGEVLRQRMIEDSRVQPDRIASIPTGQDPDKYDGARYDRARVRAEFGIPADAIAVGMLAMFRKVKGTDLYLRMAEALQAKHPQAAFLIAGDGPQSDEINAFIRDRKLEPRVRRIGYLADTAPYLAALDVFVLPSLMEGLPQVLVQALMMGKACVATEVGSVRDLHRDNFLMVPPGDEPALRAAVEQLIVDRAQAARLAAGARESVLGRFGYERMVDDVMAAYRRLVPAAA